jgi:nicotinamidase/pyrazinamidase
MTNTNSALIVVDVQNDFCPGGALAVNDGDQIVPLINVMIAQFEHVILTQDWHPHGHSSFASVHPGKEPMSVIDMPYGPQTLWPDHCVQGSSGAEFHPDLDCSKAEMIVRKGYNSDVDSYSAFFENDQKTPTGLSGYLRERGLRRLTLAGLATDFCVAFSAIDAAVLGFETSVRIEACRGIDVAGSLDAALAKMKDRGVKLVSG